MNKNHIVACIMLLPAICFTACKDNSTPVSSKPHIEFLGLYPSSIRYGSAKDTLIIKYNFADDQNLSNSSLNLTFRFDKGGDSVEIKNVRFPEITDNNLVDNKRGMTGVAYIVLPAPYIYITDTAKRRKNLPSYTSCSFYLRDPQGNNSDTITTGKFYIDFP